MYYFCAFFLLWRNLLSINLIVSLLAIFFFSIFINTIDPETKWVWTLRVHLCTYIWSFIFPGCEAHRYRRPTFCMHTFSSVEYWTCLWWILVYTRVLEQSPTCDDQGTTYHILSFYYNISNDFVRILNLRVHIFQ